MSRIVLTEVSKDWGGVRAVDRVSFTAPEGKLLVLLGPSGCGKSTTLRLIAGLESASAGRIEIGGRDVTALPPAERRIAMVFQSYALFPHLTVAENIVFGLRVRRAPRAEREAKLERVARLVGLERLLQRKPAQLSGGQRQRVALGRAIIAEAPVCLMDEPLSNLDAQLRHEMRVEIRALQQRLGMTMIYVTHDQVEAMSMADEVILMRDGHIEQHGPPELLYERPATAFAARFLGTPPMNLVPIADLRALSRGSALMPALPDETLIGVRPEHIAVAAPGAGVPAAIAAIEFLGADSVVACRVGSTTAFARVAGRLAAQVGDEVGLSWPTSAEHVFATDGRRVEPPASDRHSSAEKSKEEIWR